MPLDTTTRSFFFDFSSNKSPPEIINECFLKRIIYYKKITQMKSSLKKIIYSLFLIVGLSAIFNACKKQDVQNTVFNEKKAVESMKLKLSNEGYAQINKINKKINSLTYFDKKGGEHILNLQNSSPSAYYPITQACNPGLTNCTNAEGDPSMLQTPDVLLEYSTILINCGNSVNTGTNDVEVTWQLSVPYNLKLNNQFGNTSLLSKGRLRFRNSSNVIIQSYLSITPTTIINLGADPTCADRTLFEVKYKQVGIPSSNFESGISMENNFFVYTDCDAQTSLTLTYWDTEIMLPFGAKPPCGRTDKVYISPNSGSNGEPGAMGVGITIGCTFPPNWVYPEVQHIEYQKQNSTTWYSHDITPFGYLWMNEITPGSGLWKIRYRNQMTSIPVCDGPWYEENWVF